MRPFAAIVLAQLVTVGAQAQFALTFDQSIPLIRDGVALPLAWAGGLNFVQVSDIDLDGDGDKDLFLFDRSVDKPIMLLNDGTPGIQGYTFTRAYDDVYPFHLLDEWALLRDYDGDGKEDLFAAVNAGFSVYHNVSSGGNLAFELLDNLVGSDYVPTLSPNINTYGIDVPGIEDIDGDGDIDILTFGYANQLDFHSNQSMELYGHADSLVYQVHNRCWGYFAESGANSTITLDYVCGWNVPDPEMPTGGHGTHPIEDRADVGSTLLPLDLDGDGDKDLIVGDVQSRNVVGLTNGGTIDSAYMVSQDPHFPSYDHTIELDRFVATFYEDVDKDGKRDLLASPSYAGYSENKQSLWYYRNTGTDAAPLFEKQQEDLFQDHMFDVGEGAYPVPFDFDGDGLMDLIVANFGYYEQGAEFIGKLAALRNTGTATAPAFTLVDEDYADLSTIGIGSAMYPAFGDLDGDGDKDMYVGDLQGHLHYFSNIAIGSIAEFQLETVMDADTSGTAIDVGQFAAPQLFDVDGDGLLDLLIGERNGNLNWLRNVGSAAERQWVVANDSLGGFDVAEWGNPVGYSTPFMFLNSQGQRELLVGSLGGWIQHFTDIDGDLDGQWTPADSTWQEIDEGARTGIALYDFTGDGDLDAVIGNYRGGISFWRNDVTIAVNELPSIAARNAFSLTPNPAVQETTLELQVPLTGDQQIELLDNQGRILRAQRSTTHRTTIVTGALSTGCYQIRVSMSGRTWTQRLVVLH